MKCPLTQTVYWLMYFELLQTVIIPHVISSFCALFLSCSYKSCWLGDWPLSCWVSQPIHKEQTESPPIFITIIITIIGAICLVGHSSDGGMNMLIQCLISWLVHTTSRSWIFAVLVIVAGCMVNFLRDMWTTCPICWLQPQHWRLFSGATSTPDVTFREAYLKLTLRFGDTRIKRDVNVQL